TAALSAAAAAALIVVVIGTVVLNAERDAAGSNIHSFGDALWWAAPTVTTVGYGDRYPVTGLGRALAVVLMVTGIAVLGVVTAAVAAWFVRVSQGPEDADQLKVLVTRLDELQSSVDRLAGNSTNPASTMDARGGV
ncbi:MAG: voltage-gated potassium channel, partial [Frankiaceae bacterium]|nr:voltage-gated potassium channel [Frankiaceae bacterium]